MEQTVSIEGPRRLFGVLCEPEAGRTAAVVFLHGWSGYRAGPHRLLVNLSRALRDAGIASLRFDLTGRGDSPGRYEDTDFDMMVEDALAAVSFLRARDGGGRVILCGLCSGGNVALGAASLDKDIDAAALLSTPLFAPQRDALGAGSRTRARVLRTYLAKALRPGTWYKLARGLVDFRAVRRAVSAVREDDSRKDSRRDVMRDLRGYPGRMLFLYGALDSESAGAPAYYCRFAQENGIDAAFDTIGGSDHNFYSAAGQKDLTARLCRWILSVSS